MEQTIEIPVDINGEERVFVGQVYAWQYGMRIVVDIDGVEVVFEKDDAGEFRAIVEAGTDMKTSSRQAVEAIIEVLSSL